VKGVTSLLEISLGSCSFKWELLPFELATWPIYFLEGHPLGLRAWCMYTIRENTGSIRINIKIMRINMSFRGSALEAVLAHLGLKLMYQRRPLKLQ
jgi:hypothetical protein